MDENTRLHKEVGNYMRELDKAEKRNKSYDHEHDPGCSVGLLTVLAVVVYMFGVVIVGGGYWLETGELWQSIWNGIGWPLYLAWMVLIFVLERGR